MKDTRTKILLIALLSIAVINIFLVPSFASAADQNSLTIQVLDANYKPMANAKVTILGPRNQTAQTGSNGNAYFPNIPAGTYMISAQALNYPTTAPQSLSVMGNAKASLIYGFVIALFTYSPSQPQPGEPVIFNASLSSSSGDIVSYTWAFGDGTYGENKTTSHVFTNYGVYRVELTLMSNAGAATYTQTINMQRASISPAVLLLIIPVPVILFMIYRRRQYYIIIRARIPPKHKHPHCPGNGDCENCKVTPC